MMEDILFSPPGYYCFQYHVIVAGKPPGFFIKIFYFLSVSVFVACFTAFPPGLAAGVYLNGAFYYDVLRMLMMIALLPLGSSYHYGVCQNKPPNYGTLIQPGPHFLFM